MAAEALALAGTQFEPNEIPSLLEKNPDLALDRDEQGSTPLLIAAGVGSPGLVRLLLAKRAPVNAANSSGNTPLHEAMLGGEHERAADMARRLSNMNGAFDVLGPPSKAEKSSASGTNRPKRNASDAWPRRQLEVVKLLLAAKADVNAKGVHAYTPLHMAAASGASDVIIPLLNAGADLSAKADDGSTPLHVAAANGRLDVVRTLVARNADVNARADNGGTPLHLAALGGNRDVVEVLLASSAYIDAEADDGNTPLHLVAWQGNRNAAELLLSRGANVNARNSAGQTPMDVAKAHGHQDLQSLLRQHGGHLW